MRRENFFRVDFLARVGLLIGVDTMWSISRNGSLVHQWGDSGLPQLVWRDINGNVVGDPGPLNSYTNPRNLPTASGSRFV